MLKKVINMGKLNILMVAAAFLAGALIALEGPTKAISNVYEEELVLVTPVELNTSFVNKSFDISQLISKEIVYSPMSANLKEVVILAERKKSYEPNYFVKKECDIANSSSVERLIERMTLFRLPIPLFEITPPEIPNCIKTCNT